MKCVASPKLETIEAKLKKGEVFSLTDTQYEKRTGIPLPKGKYYLLNRSALAKLCRKYGYALKLQEKKVTFVKGEEGL